MKIGILTHHYSFNYGAVLQAFALRQAVASLGHAVDILDFRPRVTRDCYETPGRLLSRKKIGFSINWRFGSYRLRLRRCQNFLRPFLSARPLLDEAALTKELANYDLIIYGSDEIWHHTNFRGFFPAFFGAHCPKSVRQISYAPSFGASSTTKPHQSAIRGFLSRFSSLSVRDTFSQAILRDECGLSAEIVCDPTLLVDFHVTASARSATQRYIAVLNLRGDPSGEELDYIRSLAKAINAKIRVLSNSSYRGTPQAWLETIAGATLLYTDSFHATLFSIRNSVPFVSVAISPKTLDALKRFGFEDRLYSPENREASLSPSNVLEIDFSLFPEKLRKSREESMAYLRKAISASSGREK